MCLCFSVSYGQKEINESEQDHGDEHVKKSFSTAVIDNEDTHSTFVHGH